jgi:uncharacterized protein (DUF1810 family)
MTDPFKLERFVKAQASVYSQVRSELRNGKKTGHWMWFIFPQFAGLGRSALAATYAIDSMNEAVAYLEHEVLGPRLRECTQLVIQVQDRSLYDIFGSPDDMKFQSSMTLFAKATTSNQRFTEALAKHCNGVLDQRTLELMKIT